MSPGVSDDGFGLHCVRGTLSSKLAVLGVTKDVALKRGILPFSLLWTSPTATLHGQTSEPPLGAFTMIMTGLYSQVIQQQAHLGSIY